MFYVLHADVAEDFLFSKGSRGHGWHILLLLPGFVDTAQRLVSVLCLPLAVLDAEPQLRPSLLGWVGGKRLARGVLCRQWRRIPDPLAPRAHRVVRQSRASLQPKLRDALSLHAESHDWLDHRRTASYSAACGPLRPQDS